MCKPFAWILALALLSQSLSALWIAAGFYANRDFIAQNQCENRFVPNSPCQGQCVLMKKLKEQGEKEQQQSDLKLKEVILFSQSPDNLYAGICGDPAETIRHRPHPADRYVFQMDRVIFHPPIS